MDNKELQSLNRVIGSWLQRLREEKGLSQDGLSTQLGKGQSDIAKMESGKKRITMVDVLLWMAALAIPKHRIGELVDMVYNKTKAKQ